jgi:hypothetical protein
VGVLVENCHDLQEALLHRVVVVVAVVVGKIWEAVAAAAAAANVVAVDSGMDDVVGILPFAVTEEVGVAMMVNGDCSLLSDHNEMHVVVVVAVAVVVDVVAWAVEVGVALALAVIASSSWEEVVEVLLFVVVEEEGVGVVHLHCLHYGVP